MEKVTQVYPLDGYRLKVQFSTGETRIFDALPYLQKGVFQQLQDEMRFKQAYVALDTVCWPGGLDIAPETLYDRSRPE
ncbi:DUF2442 domain-containing protein [Desulfoplanes sp.]